MLTFAEERATAATAERKPAPARAPAAPAVDPAGLLRLQRSAGNAMVAGMLARCPDCNGTCAEAAEGGNPVPAAAVAAAEPIDPAQAAAQIAAAGTPEQLQAVAAGLKAALAERTVTPSAAGVATLARAPAASGGGGRAAGNFCVPYGLLEMIDAAEDKAFLVGFLPAASTSMFQSSEVGGLWADYLLNPTPPTHTYRGAASTVVRGFETAAVSIQWHRRLFDQAVNQLKAAPPALAATGDTRVPVASLLSSTDLPIDFSNPFDIPGHIAGGVGSGDASVDSRDIAGDLIVRRQVDLSGTTTGYEVISDFHYHCHDTVDFCPGQPGSGLEQNLTIPLSRLEATGMAHDVPFDVYYQPAALTATLTPGDLPTAPAPGGDRDLPGRDPDRRDSRDLRTPVDRRDGPAQVDQERDRR